MTRRLILLALAALVSCAASFAQNQNQLVNGTFDTDVSGWMADPWHPERPGVAEWDPILGQPPGALSITDDYGSILTEACFPVPAGAGDYYFEADAYMKTSGTPLFCNIEWALYETADCSGSYAILRPEPLSSWVFEQNRWERLEWTMIGLSNNAGTKAARPVLGKAVLGAADPDDACVFDNVYFEVIVDPVAPPPIPAVSPAGLAVIALLLGFAGLVVLRRRTAAG